MAQLSFLSYAPAAAILPFILAASATAQQPSDAIDGRWDATLISHGVQVPFRLDISGSGPSLKGTLYNGFDPYDGTTSATFYDGKLVLQIEHYLTTIAATFKDGELTGSVITVSKGAASESPFQATRHVESSSAAITAPSIAGSWIIPLDSPNAKGEKAVRFLVQQRGDEVAASILRVDGDTGAYSGVYKDGKWLLSHYDGSRPGVIEVSPSADGTLAILQNTAHPQPASRTAADDRPASPTVLKLTAYREEVAKAKGLPEPENYETHTTAREPGEKFQFNFPDADGKPVSNDDPRFKGKVVLAIVTGTWCPNCHDEAQYLVQLDKKYRSRGLAIVALDFEEPEQQNSLERQRAFVKKYGVEYTYLIAGAPSELAQKVPQLANLNTWPATVFIGRDGSVRGVHAGFASPAAAEFHRQLEEEFTSKIETLLAEKPDQASLAPPVSTPAH